MSKSGDVSPRPEAQQLEWQELTDDQQKAAKQACSLLRKLAEESWKKPEERKGSDLFLPPIDERRQNHVILLDGGRGSGKTALLVTLVNAWNWGVRGYRKEAFDPVEVFKEMLKPKGQIVPVGLIDLQPLPPSTNLLIHLGGQFQRVINAIEHRSADMAERRRDRPPWHDAEESEPKCVTKWREFLRAAASGWDGSLQGRRANLDPEAYALEVEEAGRKRLDVVLCFRAMIDELVEEYRAYQQMDETPLFLVAIDDADMNPARSLELLDLLRMLWHPRVAFLLTGDSELFLEVLLARMFSELKRPLGGLVLPDGMWAELGSTPGRGAKLAAEIYKKVIPPGQRLKLRPLSPQERFAKLEATLKRTPAPRHPLKPESLAEYFTVQTQAQAILPERMREIRDLEQAIFQRMNEKDLPVDELSEREQQAVTNEISWEICESHGAQRLMVWESGETMDVESSLAAQAERAATTTWNPAPEKAIELPLTEELKIIFQHDLRLRVQELSPPLSLGDRAVLMFAADSVHPVSNARLGLRGLVVRVMYRSERRDLFFDWQLPDWPTFLDYAGFLLLWNKVTGLDVDPRSVGAALAGNLGETARRFLSTVLAFVRLREERPQVAARGKVPSLLSALDKAAASLRSRVPTWAELAVETVALVNRPVPEGVPSPPEVVWARGRAGLLAAPESALSAHDANQWLAELKREFGAGWAHSCKTVESQWTFRMLRALGFARYDADSIREMNKFREVLRLRFPEHVWLTEMSSGGDDLVQRLAQEFSSVNIQAPAVPTNYLRSYLTAKRQRGLDRASEGLKRRWLRSVDGLREGQGIAPHVVAALWKGTIESGEAPRLSAVKGAPDIRQLDALYDSLGEDPWGHVSQSSTWDIGPRVRAREAIFGWREDTGFDQTLEGALFEFVYDVLIDNGQATRAYTPALDWWDAGGCRRETSEGGLYPWPAVGWLTYLDHEILSEAWNRTYPIAQRAAEVAPEDESIGDDLAFWFIGAEMAISQARVVSTPWTGGIREGQWSGIVKQISDPSHQRAHQGARWAAYAAWCRAVPLFAAPESGLSTPVAETILGSIEISDARRQELHKLRRDRMYHRKPKGRPIEPELKRIDDAHPDHPWVKLIEQR